MATKPTIANARWATSGASLVTPSGGDRDTGFVGGTVISSGVVDYILNQLYQWALYLSDGALVGGTTLDTLHVTGTSALDGAVTAGASVSAATSVTVGAASSGGTTLSSDGTTLTITDRIAAPRIVSSAASPFCHTADELLRIPVLNATGDGYGRTVDASPTNLAIPVQTRNLDVISSYGVEGFCTDSGNLTVELVGVTSTGTAVVDTISAAVTAGLPFTISAAASYPALNAVSIFVSTGTAEVLVRCARVGYNRPAP